MQVTASDIAWFTQQLENSSDAAVKLFYLTRFSATDTAATTPSEASQADPMNLACHSTWTLPRLLQVARLISCDERTLWERLGPGFAAAFQVVLHSWNEQQAVKLVHHFLTTKLKEEVGGDASGVAAVEQELRQYVDQHVKPQGYARVAGSTRVGDDDDDVMHAATTEVTSSRICGCTAVVPMRDGDVYSEGSLVCAGAVPAFGELLRVPRHLMFYAGSVVEHCALGRVIAADPRLASILENEEALLVLCFIYEYFLVGQARSHWSQLLRYCPPAYPTVPAFMDLASLTELAGLDVVDEVIERRGRTSAFCAEVQPALPVMLEGLRGAAQSSPSCPESALDQTTFESAFTVEKVTFAKATFDSRAFNLHVDGTDVLSLVPWADMINHQNRSDVLIRRVEDNGGDFVMQVGAALGTADAGRELWMSYGPLQNWELLQYYGFVLEDNEHDQLPFPFTADETDEDGGGEWAARRQALREQFALLGVGRCWVSRHGRPCAALRALMRLYMARAEEFPVMENSINGPFEHLSAETELQVVAAIAATADAVLEQFPTTLEEDREILSELDGDCEGGPEGSTNEDDAVLPSSSDHTQDNLRLCLRVRMGVKEIAQRLHEWCAGEEARLALAG